MPLTNAGLNKTRKGADWYQELGMRACGQGTCRDRCGLSKVVAATPCAHISTMITSKVLDSQTRKPTTEVPLSCHTVRPIWTR